MNDIRIVEWRKHIEIKQQTLFFLPQRDVTGELIFRGCGDVFFDWLELGLMSLQMAYGRDGAHALFT